MIRSLFIIAAIVFFVCAAAQWGIGTLTQVEEIAAGLAAFAAADLVAPVVTYARTRRVDEVV